MRRKSTARLETCRSCGKEWQVSTLALISPEGYICPVCETKQRKERLYGSENNQKRGYQSPGKYQH